MSAPPARPPTGPLGAWEQAPGVVGFRIWAPAATTVDLLLDGRVLPMAREPDGCFAVEADAADGARYRYRIDGGEAVPDQASRWQPDGVHGASAVLGTAYPWRCTAWTGRPWAEAVIYEVHVGTCGGYAGVRAQLPRLAALGITALELMPVAEFPGRRNWGYDGTFPYAPASAYGDPRELKALVDEAHAHGLMVLLDVVYNHFGPDGNHLGRYAPAFFRTDLPTPWGAAIDFTQPAVQRYFIDNALMWLREYRFDGLRLDAVHAIAPTAFLAQLREAIVAALPPGRQVHLVLENERNQATLLREGYTAQWNDDFHNALHVLLTGEREGYYAAFADDPTAHLARVLTEGFAFQGQADARGHLRGEPSGDLSPARFVVFAQNHDQIGNRAFGERLGALVDEPRLRSAMALTALTPMIPLFFMGEPWGARQPFLFFTDFAPPLDAAVREGRRREFAHFAAFADEARRARIPDPNDEATFLASRAPPEDAARGAGARWGDLFTGLLALRRQWLVPGLAQARALPLRRLGDGALAAGWQLPAGDWHVAFNFGPVPVPMPAGADCLLWAENLATGRAELPVDGFIAWRGRQP